MYKAILLITSCVIAQVTAHAVVTTPTPRALGPAATQACGAAVAAKLKSDLTGPIENSVAKIDSTYNAAACPLYFCRGYQYADNVANTRQYTAGSVVHMEVDLVAHHTGYANVSIVDLQTRKILGSPIMVWPVYANSSLGPSKWPKNETSFDVTVPNLNGKCATGGLCAIQWFWYATENRQTYESCIDFTQ